jgi:hypothetical protein
MSSSLDKLNLRPSEKRLLVGIGIVLFLVLNVLFVWPKFGEFGRLRAETEKIQREIARFQTEIDKEPTYQKLLRELAGQGSQVIREEQTLKLQQTVQSQALASGVTINSYAMQNSRTTTTVTNAFFDEQSLVVTYDTNYRPLINFLVNLAEDESMIRVRNMDVKPDLSRQRLQGNITLVASYQKSRPNAPTAPNK